MSNLSNEKKINFIIFSSDSLPWKALTNIGLLWSNERLFAIVHIGLSPFTHSLHPQHLLISFSAFSCSTFFSSLWFPSWMLSKAFIVLHNKTKTKKWENKIYDFALFLSKWNKLTVQKKKLLSRKSLENPVPPSFPLKFIHYDLLLWRTFYFLDQAQVEACFSLTLQFWSGYHHPAELKSFREIWKLYQALSS